MSNDEHDLIAILDWGLGHASRCVPLIEELANAERTITIASSGKALLFLRQHFPTYNFIVLPSYNVRYLYSSMVMNLVTQLPRVAKVIWQEHQCIRAAVQKKAITRIISDGRFGCWHPDVESIWLAHQLQIQHRYTIFAQAANTAYHDYIRRRFQKVWIPDRAAEPRLAGVLSRPISGLPYRYLGPQSRYQEQTSSPVSTYYHYLALLSGPEPQRTKLAHLLRKQLSALRVPTLLVRGIPGDMTIRRTIGQLHEVDWLLGADLEAAIQQAETIICRSGYSTLMDAWYWQKPLLLVPTPGQTEQEYLARYWAAQTWAEWQPQSKLSLRTVKK